jgi:hypothetical protein
MKINDVRVSFTKAYVPAYNRYYFTVYSTNILTNKELWVLLKQKYGVTADTYGTIVVNHNKEESQYSLYRSRGYKYSSKIRVDFDMPKAKANVVPATKLKTAQELINVTELINMLKDVTGAKNVTLVW